MARGGEELHDLGEARRHVVDHDDEDTVASSRVDESPVDEEKSSRRSEGLDTLKCYLREIRHSTLLTFKQEQQLGKRVMAGDEQARQADDRIESPSRDQYRQAVYASRVPLLRCHRRGQSWADQGRRKIQLQARVSLQYLCLLVDPAIHRTSDYQSGKARAVAGACGGAAESVSRQGRSSSFRSSDENRPRRKWRHG